MKQFKSEAQRRRCAQLVKDGKLTQEEFDKWNRATPPNLPERAGEHPAQNGLVRGIKPKRAKR